MMKMICDLRHAKFFDCLDTFRVQAAFAQCAWKCMKVCVTDLESMESCVCVCVCVRACVCVCVCLCVCTYTHKQAIHAYMYNTHTYMYIFIYTAVLASSRSKVIVECTRAGI
jgi:hypothetical protein